MKFSFAAFAAIAVSLAAAAPQAGPPTGPPTSPPTNPPSVTVPGHGPPTSPPGTPPGGSQPPRSNFLIQIDAPDWAGRNGMNGRWIRPEADPVSGVNYLTVNQPNEGKARNFWFSRMWDNGLGNVNYVVSGASLWGGFLQDDLDNTQLNIWPAYMANSAAGDQMWWFDDTFFASDGHFQRMPPTAQPGQPTPVAMDKWALCWVKIQDAFKPVLNDRLALHWYRNKDQLDLNQCWPVRVKFGN